MAIMRFHKRQVLRFISILWLAAAAAGWAIVPTGETKQSDTVSFEEEPIAKPEDWTPNLSEQETYPFPIGTKPFAAVVAARTTSAPVLMVAPFSDSNRAQTTASMIFRGMLSFYLLGAPRDHLLLNLIPDVAVTSPYIHEDGENFSHGRPQADYERDARAIGADLLICGKVDDGADSTSVELILRDFRDNRTNTWHEIRTSASFPNLLSSALTTIYQFSALHPGEAQQLAPSQETLPDSELWRIMKHEVHNVYRDYISRRPPIP